MGLCVCAREAVTVHVAEARSGQIVGCSGNSNGEC